MSHPPFTTAVLALACLAWSTASAQNTTSGAVLGCVAAERLACGCHIRIKALACPARATANEPHFFTGLEAQDPLLLQLGGKDIELAQVRHSGRPAKADRQGRWTDTYQSQDLSVRVSYTPSKSTCPKANADGCEYTDYTASVVLQARGQAPRTYRATPLVGAERELGWMTQS